MKRIDIEALFPLEVKVGWFDIWFSRNWNPKSCKGAKALKRAMKKACPKFDFKNNLVYWGEIGGIISTPSGDIVSLSSIPNTNLVSISRPIEYTVVVSEDFHF